MPRDQLHGAISRDPRERSSEAHSPRLRLVIGAAQLDPVTAIRVAAESLARSADRLMTNAARIEGSLVKLSDRRELLQRMTARSRRLADEADKIAAAIEAGNLAALIELRTALSRARREGLPAGR